MPQQANDGRRERTEVTRGRILASARKLILSGKYDPTAEAIAKQAGITKRTLFRHFPDMETLHREIILDAQSHARSVMDEAFSNNQGQTEQWQELLKIVIERRVRIYEYLLPLHISSVYQRFRSDATDKVIRQDIRRRRKRLQEILPDEIASDELFFESLDAMLSIEYWISLRRDQQLSTTRATQVLHYVVALMTKVAG